MKKILAIVLTLAMIVAVLPLSVFAVDTELPVVFFDEDTNVQYAWDPYYDTCTATLGDVTETVDAVVTEVPPTCIEAGYVLYTATFTNDLFETQEHREEGDPAINPEGGHTWVDATCTTPKTCSVCGATEGEAAGGHTWGEATYTWDLENKSWTATHTCTACSTVESETKPAPVEYVAPTDDDNAYFKSETVFDNEAFEAQIFVWGDATGDGLVKNTDIVRLKNYLANYDDDTGVSSNGTTTYELSPGADATGDGAIKNTDIVRLKNYLANYDDETGISSNGSTTYNLGPKVS